MLVRSVLSWVCDERRWRCVCECVFAQCLSRVGLFCSPMNCSSVHGIFQPRILEQWCQSKVCKNQDWDAQKIKFYDKNNINNRKHLFAGITVAGACAECFQHFRTKRSKYTELVIQLFVKVYCADKNHFINLDFSNPKIDMKFSDTMLQNNLLSETKEAV